MNKKISLNRTIPYEIELNNDFSKCRVAQPTVLTTLPTLCVLVLYKWFKHTSYILKRIYFFSWSG